MVATKKAVMLAERWLKEEQRHQRMLVMDRDTFPGDVPSPGPVWTGKPEDVEANLEAYLAIPPEDLPDDKLDLPDLPAITLEKAREQTLSRIKAKANRDAKAHSTYYWYEQHLRLGMVADAIDSRIAVNHITIEHIERYCDFWCDLQARAKDSTRKSFRWPTAWNRLGSPAGHVSR